MSVLIFFTGASLNDTVTQYSFDSKPFTLIFPTVDDIDDSIRRVKGTAMLAKIDVIRTFAICRLIQLTPSIGIRWNSKYYLDVWLGPWECIILDDIRCHSVHDEAA